jgi:hypothetical protein
MNICQIPLSSKTRSHPYRVVTVLTLLFLFLNACSSTSRDVVVVDDGLMAPAGDVSTDIVEQQPRYVFDEDQPREQRQESKTSGADHDFQQTSPPSGTVVALLNQARLQKESGRPERAAAVLERALRLDPKNARLWHELAQVRLEQGKLDLAERLAVKSNALAKGDTDLMDDNRILIKQVNMLRGE